MANMNLFAALPEIVLLVAACMILVADLFVPDERRNVTYGLSMAALVAVAAVLWLFLDNRVVTYAFNGMYVADPMTSVLKLFAVVAVGFMLVYAQGYARDRGLWKGELFTLTLFALLGIMLMISANNLLVIYLGLELQALSLYALVALRRDDARSSEAAMKYFVLGALASGFLLYGMSMLYGGSGTLDINELARRAATGQVASRLSLVLGVVFVIAGLAFKLGAVPFQWVPDVYHGAPTPVTLLIGSAPKLAIRRRLHPRRGPAAARRRLAEDADRAGGRVARAGQPHGDRADEPQADAGVLDHRADGLHAARDALGRHQGRPAATAAAYSAAMFYVVTHADRRSARSA